MTDINTLKDQVKDNLHETASAARKTLSSASAAVSETARAVGEDVQARASESLAAVRETTTERLDEARDALTDSSDRLARTLREAADAAGPVQTRLLSSVANGVEMAAEALRGRGIGDIAADIRDLARRNPAAFAAGAAVAGFALARFLRSSAQQSAMRQAGPPAAAGSTYAEVRPAARP